MTPALTDAELAAHLRGLANDAAALSDSYEGQRQAVMYARFEEFLRAAADALEAERKVRIAAEQERDQWRTGCHANEANTLELGADLGEAKVALIEMTAQRDNANEHVADLEARLATAEGLLREVYLAQLFLEVDQHTDTQLQALLKAEYSADWIERRDAFLNREAQSTLNAAPEERQA